MEDVLVPSIFFISIAAVLIAFSFFRYKARSDVIETVRTALKKGVELDPAVISNLGVAAPHKNRDLRVALIWLSIAVALVLAGIAVPEPEALRGMLAAAAFPFSIGCAYLIMVFFVHKDKQ